MRSWNLSGPFCLSRSYKLWGTNDDIALIVSILTWTRQAKGRYSTGGVEGLLDHLPRVYMLRADSLAG